MAKRAAKNTYSSYLQVDRLLSSQTLQTDSDNELLFIVIHQSHELWFKLAIHELNCAIRALEPPRARNGRSKGSDASACVIAFKHLSRVSQIQELLIGSWGVLRTLTPDEFHVFRDTVGRDGASGFQSVQYRELEYKLGLKYRTVTIEIPRDGQVMKHEVDVLQTAPPAARVTLQQALASPSIYDAVIAFIARTHPRYAIATKVARDFTQPHRKSVRVFNAWRDIYADRIAEPELYQLGEKLVDIEDAFRRWRFNHLALVSRIIGSNSGTGGSTGLRYLKGVANQLFDEPMYPELWDVRNYMFQSGKLELSSLGY